MAKKITKKLQPEESYSLETIKALVVDDQAENLSLFKTILERKGYQVVTCMNGEDALQKLSEDATDIILSDILMPVMDGFHLLRECKADERLKQIPFIFLTGAFLDKQDEDLAWELGVDAFLRKPVEPAELLRVLGEVLENKVQPGKKDKKRKVEKETDADKLINVNLLEKLEKKMADLEEEIAQRNKVEQALRYREEQYRLLYETMAQGIIYQSPDGSITSANPAAQRILGLTADQLLGRTSRDLRWKAIHEDGSDFPGDEHPAMVALKTGQPVKDVVMGILNPVDEQFHWINVNAVPQFYDGQDKPYQVYTTFEDITDRFLSFKAIQESESRLTAMIDNTLDAIWSIDRERRVVAVNDAGRSYYLQAAGAEPREGMDILEPMPDEPKLFWLGICEQALSGEHITFEQHYDLKEGPLEIEFSANPVVTASGKVIGISFFGRNVSERNKIARVLKESEEKYRAVVENAAEVIVISQEGKIKFVNHLFIPPITGYTLEDFYSKPMTEFVHPDDREKLIDRYLRRLKGENFTDAYTTRLVARDGTVFWVELRATIIEWEGKPATLAVMNNITERKVAERALLESEERYRVLVESANEGIHVVQDRIIKFANAKFAEITGYAIEELINKKGIELIHPLDHDVMEERHQRRMGGEPLNDPFTYRFLTKDNHTIWVELGAVPINWQGSPAFLYFANDVTARKQAEDALKQSEEKYRTILEQMDEGYYEVDAKGNYTFFNDSVCRKLGYARDELMGLNYKAYIAREEWHRVVGAFAEVFSTGNPRYWFPITMLKKDGTKVYVEDSIQALKNAKGEIIGLRGISRDVTGRKETEDALHKSEEKYRTILEEIDEAYYEINMEGNYTFFNDALCRQTGYAREELLGMNYKVYIPPEETKVIYDVFNEVYRTGNPRLWQPVTNIRKDGTKIFLEDSIYPIKNDKGEVTGFRGVSRDVTRRKRDAMALQESEQSFRSLFEYNPVAVYMQDLDGRFMSVNDAFCKQSGYSREELLVLDWRRMIEPEDEETALNHFRQAIHGQPQSYEFNVNTKNSEKRNLNLTLVPMLVNNKLQGIYGIAEDITERKKAAEKISSTLEGTIDAIAMMSELRDPYTAGHQKMVTQLALAIAREMGFPEDHMQALRVAGLLHDVGKVYVPSEILSKPGKLSELERGLAKGHASASYDIVKAIKFPWPVCRIIIQHHERLDGSGYPKGLKGDEIIPEAKILAVADVVEAMVSHRPYRPALGIDKALDEITQNRGVLYDDQTVEACVRLFREKEFQFAQ